jgi:hypothetical protein
MSKSNRPVRYCALTIGPTQVYETHARLALEEGDQGMYLQCASRLRELAALGLASPNRVEFQAYQILFYACAAMPDWAAQPGAGYDQGTTLVHKAASITPSCRPALPVAAPASNKSLVPAVYVADARDDLDAGSTMQSIEIGQRNPTAVLLQAVQTQDLCHPAMVCLTPLVLVGLEFERPLCVPTHHAMYWLVVHVLGGRCMRWRWRGPPAAGTRAVSLSCAIRHRTWDSLSWRSIWRAREHLLFGAELVLLFAILFCAPAMLIYSAYFETCATWCVVAQVHVVCMFLRRWRVIERTVDFFSVSCCDCAAKLSNLLARCASSPLFVVVLQALHRALRFDSQAVRAFVRSCLRARGVESMPVYFHVL